MNYYQNSNHFLLIRPNIIKMFHRRQNGTEDIFLYLKILIAGTPGNRTQLLGLTKDNGFEDRDGHQPRNHSQY